MFGIWCKVWGGITGSREGWMAAAADTMARAAITIDSALETHARRLGDWLQRLETILREHAARMEKTP